MKLIDSFVCAFFLGVFDNCSYPLSEKGWSVGIQAADPSGRKDGRFFFSLRTDRALKSTTIIAHQRYQPNSWTHVVASYDGHKMALYVDNSKVGESREQSGDLYSPYIKACRLFLLGGDQSDHEHSFRGHLGGVALWGYVHTHEELLKGHQSHVEKQTPILSQWADFSEVENQWAPYKGRHNPVIVALPIPERQLVSPFLPPPCGVTMCDNADFALSYNQHWQLRAEKRLRYRIVNICKDDGSDPTVSLQQIQLQHQALEDAFRPYNITLELSIHTIYNSSLQQRFILSNCHIAKVGNRYCDPECDHPLTGHDGVTACAWGPATTGSGGMESATPSATAFTMITMMVIAVTLRSQMLQRPALILSLLRGELVLQYGSTLATNLNPGIILVGCARAGLSKLGPGGPVSCRV